MTKLTFRADDDLVARLERLDESKSEVMREALRAYLDDPEPPESSDAGSVDAVIADRVDSLVEERLADRDRSVDVNITVEGAARASDAAPAARGRPAPQVDRACGQCGESLDADDVYCPNCGERAAERAHCECGEELRADWAHCPSCGRRTPSADVLDR